MDNDDRLIFLLGQSRHHLITSLDKALLSRAGVTAAQSGALFYLMKMDGCLLSHLSEGLMLDNSAITGMVDRLEKKKFIQRQSCPGDRRAIKIYLTKAGRDAACKALPVVKEYNQMIKKGFSSEEVDAFRRILRAIIDRFGGKTRAG